MLSGKAQAATAPTALGSLLQASTYGATIPNIYGMTLSPLLAIWAANLRQGGSVKKFKQLKKGITAYVENIDFLLGSNPIVGVQQLWINGANIPLQFGAVPGITGLELSNATLPTTVKLTTGGDDPDFYAVIGITATLPYSVSFDDYGGPGTQTLSGNFEAPLWNVHQNGPDPNDSGAFRYFPLTYEWLPEDGPVISAGSNDFFVGGPPVTVWISRLTEATSLQPPLQKYRMAFEPMLGSGTEYSDADLSDQQIIYPMFAGIGSSDIDLGSSGALPQLQAEVQGKFGVYATGDCDFADMIEDTVKSGTTQAAIGAGDTAAGVTAVEHGLSGYDFPGVIQKRVDWGVESFTRGPMSYPINVTAGNFLVVISSPGLGLGISDTLGNSWTPVFPVDLGYQVWYAQANGSGANTVTITNSSGTHFSWQITVMEIAGVDTFDGVSIGDSTGRVSIPATNAQGFPEYLLNINQWISPINPKDPQNPLWPAVISSENYYSFMGGSFAASSHCTVLERRTYTPGTYGIQQNTNVNPVPDACCMLAFKCVNAPSYPRPVGDFMDNLSLDAVRHQCRAYGLYGSLSMNSQQAASDWLKTLYDAADAAPVFMGFQLFSFPYAEASAVGNGAIYTAPTASGPVANLSDSNGDFVPAEGDAPITVTGTARVDQPNVLQMQCLNRTSNYNPSLVEQPDAAGISLFGVRKADPITNNAVQDVSIARALLGIQVRKLQYGGDVYAFTLPAKWCLLAPMDLITVTDTLADINAIPVRLTSIVEQSDQSLECEAEPFVYGMYSPTPFTADTPAPYAGNPNSPVELNINPPIIFEATPRLAQQTSPAQIWCVISCQSANYGGCIPYISTDGGESYTLVSESPVIGSAECGQVAQGEWPAASDPDTTNNLFISFAETLPDPPGVLPSFSAQQRDSFQAPCYVGFANFATVQANFLSGDTSQITELGVLFSDPTILNPLPSDATIINIFPVVLFNTQAPGGSPVVSQFFDGTGMTPTSGGTNMFGPVTGAFTPGTLVPTGGGPGIGTSLTGQEMRFNLALGTTGAAACESQIISIGWAILYSSAVPTLDPNVLEPFVPNPGEGWGWAIPKTVTTGMVGAGTNATVTGFGGIPPAGLGYELISYNSATLTLPGQYTINATGSGNEIRRGVYAAPSPGMGMDHPPFSPFALLSGDTGIVKLNMDPAWIGIQLWFKFPTFNTFGAATESLADTTAYPFTPTGAAGNIGPATGGILVNGA